MFTHDFLLGFGTATALFSLVCIIRYWDDIEFTIGYIWYHLVTPLPDQINS